MDRVSATAIAVLVAYVLLLQAVIGGLGQGAMAASAADPLHVICSSSGVEGDGSAKTPVDCPCAALCRISSIGTPDLVVAPGVLLHRAKVNAFRFSPVDETASVPPLRGLLPAPRAPPLFS